MKNSKAPELISSIMDEVKKYKEIETQESVLLFVVGYLQSYLSSLEEKIPGLTEEFQKRIDMFEQTCDD